METSVPVKLTGKSVAYPATPLLVIRVNGEDLIPGDVLPYDALGEFVTSTFVRFHVTEKVKLAPVRTLELTLPKEREVRSPKLTYGL